MKESSSKRELVNTGTDKRYVRRDEKGHFKESDDQVRSLSKDPRQHAKTKSERGQGIAGTADDGARVGLESCGPRRRRAATESVWRVSPLPSIGQCVSRIPTSRAF